jgi:hypothetical protein
MSEEYEVGMQSEFLVCGGCFIYAREMGLYACAVSLKAAGHIRQGL